MVDEANNAVHADNALRLSAEARDLRSASKRLGHLITQLRSFRFAPIAQMLSGLLTVPANHAATLRIESLIHLAAMACRGCRVPTLKHLRTWLNVFIYQDCITHIEDPVEDVFISTVATWSGNRRLFQGNSSDTDYYVQALFMGLSRIIDHPWVPPVLRSVNALLMVSDAIAERSGLPPHTTAESKPREPVALTREIVDKTCLSVRFTDSDLASMNVSLHDLDPFLFQPKHACLLGAETLGNSTLERRPLIRANEQTIVAVPTALGTAVRRYMVQNAVAAGDLHALESSVNDEQFMNIRAWASLAWKIQPQPITEQSSPPACPDIVGTFDDGGYVHVVFVIDDLADATDKGIQSIHQIERAVMESTAARATVLSEMTDYRCGLTIVVHGGIGRAFLLSVDEPPPGWHYLMMPIADFMRLGWDDEMTALRAWKLLHQEQSLAQMGVDIVNLSGFANLYAFACSRDFRLVPREMEYSPGAEHLCVIDSGMVTELRHRLRVALNQHVAISPDQESLVEVQRGETTTYFQEMKGLPIYYSWRHMATGTLLGCVETRVGPWWVQYGDQPPSALHRRLVFQIWHMALSWIVPLSVVVERRSPSLFRGGITYCLRFPDIDKFTDAFALSGDAFAQPRIDVDAGLVTIHCTAQYLRSFVRAENTGDRFMIHALAKGLSAVYGGGNATDDELEAIVAEVVSTDSARFVHLRPARSCRDTIHFFTPLPEPRLVQPEDRAWSEFNLASRAGWTGGSGPILHNRAGKILERAVDEVWSRIKRRLAILDRASVVVRALLNYEAVEKERNEWDVAAAALVSICRDREDVIWSANEREAQRDLGALASRVLAEMAVSAAKEHDGGPCTFSDLDYMLAEVATLLECASGSDALRYGIAGGAPTVNANGSFGFDFSSGSDAGRYWSSQREKDYEEAIIDYAGYYTTAKGDKGSVDPGFDDAFIAELGISLEQYAKLATICMQKSVERSSAYLQLRRSEVLRWLEGTGVNDAMKAFWALSLRPRRKWDEASPENASMRDWYPWRFGRRLSIMRRPLIQVTTDEDPYVLVMPALLERTTAYLMQGVEGYLPAELFDSRAMKQWIGNAVNRRGHAFNRQVAERLRELGWSVRAEVNVTELGGADALGDVDVLAWRYETGKVCAIECKRLRFDRTIGEIGERLMEYSDAPDGGNPTLAKRHVDRINFLNRSPGGTK